MIKAIVETLETVDEPFRGLYKQNAEGKFVLNVEPVGGFALEDVNGLKTALNSERDARKTAESSLKVFEGIDATAARDAIANAEKFKNFDPEKDAERIAQTKFDALKTQLLETHAGELATVTGERDVLRSTLINDALETAATRAIAAAKGSAPLLTPIIKSRTKADIVDGKVVVSVLDASGNVRIKDHVNNTPFSVDDLVGELRADEAFGRAFEANPGGSGADPLKRGGPSANKPDIGGTPEQRRAAFAAKHPELNK